MVRVALNETIADVQFHFPQISQSQIIEKIESNDSELAIFLYRLGRNILLTIPHSTMLKHIHWIMREVCSCEIYFSNQIDVGFYLVHGIGTVIGSRNVIGKGFKIYQGCIIGHRLGQSRGVIIGDHVTVFAHSQILGDIQIGNHVTVDCLSLVIKDVPDKQKCVGIPARYEAIK
ncbi:MAG: hypothetical protein HQM12_13265 [SAR324 cluster bacterium]|nr:hypothetical protein [SAR324 cluster bacterium]